MWNMNTSHLSLALQEINTVHLDFFYFFQVGIEGTNDAIGS